MKRMPKPCPVCALSWLRTFDQLLAARHSSLCLYWESRRRGSYLTPAAIARHQRQHTGFGEPMSLARPFPWWYVAPYPDLTRGRNAPEIVLVRGLPGTGKTPFAARFAHTHRHLETDHFFLEPGGTYRYDRSQRQQAYLWCLLATYQTLQQGIPVVVANTFLTLEALTEYYQMALEFSVPLRIFSMPDTLPRTMKEADARGSHLFEYVNISTIGIMRKKWETFPSDSQHKLLQFESCPPRDTIMPDALLQAEWACGELYYCCPPGLCPHARHVDFADIAQGLRRACIERYPHAR